MKVVRGISHWDENFRNPVVAIGVFDGLHHGHRLLLQKTRERAKIIGGTPLVMTFHPHPAKVIHPERELSLIASLEYRLRLLRNENIEACLVVNFTKRFARISPDHFVQHYLVQKLKAREIVVGDDFHFGHNRRGDICFLQKCAARYGFLVHAIPVCCGVDRRKVSSSQIRKFIARGDIEHARELLERPVTILGRIIRGDRRGRELGYPTANLDAMQTGFAPRGVYCVRVYLNEMSLEGMANIGSRPSFKKEGQLGIEVHLFDFNKNIYGKEILVEFLKKIRDEKFFPSREALIEQLKIDEKQARQWFAGQH
ncbi:MAG: bifunctional riboflavin kinase/FAD synthetase [Candidatus Omnitrophota bacterium]